MDELKGEINWPEELRKFVEMKIREVNARRSKEKIRKRLRMAGWSLPKETSAALVRGALIVIDSSALEAIVLKERDGKPLDYSDLFLSVDLALKEAVNAILATLQTERLSSDEARCRFFDESKVIRKSI